MTSLPITRMTLYKHGVGYFERRAKLSGPEVEMSFRVEEMNDILKSLTAIDLGGGQVLGIDYATPQSRAERLAGCSVRLGDGRSLRDLLVGLRGRRVSLALDQAESVAGTLLGLDELPERQPIAESLLSLLLDDSDQVQVVSLGRVQGVEILDERGADDLRFFLQTALGQEDYRQVTIRLTPDEHDLVVSYVAPAPTWRVSYRLVLDADAEGGPSALLLGWGIFDNRLEEDIEDISLALVAGMPISFVYDLYTPFTPQRPVVKEEARVAPSPVEFAAPAALAMPAEAERGIERFMRAAPAGGVEKSLALQDALRQTTAVEAEGVAMGEMFKYVIATPVTVGRGQSAMVPIVSTDLGYRKDLLYNGTKLPAHPVATLRMENASGLTLERGPVTVMGGVEYLGEAVLPLTAPGDELNVPYAVELGVLVQERNGAKQVIHQVRVRKALFYFEVWDVRWREYQVNNHADGAVTVLVEHPRTAEYDLFDTPDPVERTDEHLRFEIQTPARAEAKLRVFERQLTHREEKLERQSYAGLKRYLGQGLIDQEVYDRVAEILGLWEKIADHEAALKQVEKDREGIYKAQAQIQGNMGALSQTGKEGALRARYVEQLEATEEQLKALAKRESDLRDEIEQIRQEIETRLESLE
jgi:hypothetical protein